MKSLLYLLIGLLALVPAASSSTRSPDGPIDEEGLAQRVGSGFDQLLVRPETNFGQYQKVLIEPATVSYRKRLGEDSLNRGDDAYQFDQRELDHFNQQLINALSNQWKKSLGWELTQQGGPGVVVVTTQITELYLYASIKNDTAVPTRTLAGESSEMVITMTMFDAESGEVLLHSSGTRRTGRRPASHGSLNRATSASYWNDVYQAFRQWAGVVGTEIK